MLWDDLVDRYFAAALLATTGSSSTAKIDADAIAASNPTSHVPFESRVKCLAYWLWRYGAARVSRKVLTNNEGFSRAAARRALRFFDRLTRDGIPDKPSPEFIDRCFGDLRLRIGNAYDGATGRGATLIVATAKTLWTRFPNCAPIYDSQAATAVYGMTKFLKVLSRVPSYVEYQEEAEYEKAAYDVLRPRRYDNENHIHRDGWYYRDYHGTHDIFYELCRPRIETLLQKEGSTATPYRVFDKMLWIVGNEGRDYSLRGYRMVAGSQLIQQRF